MAAQTLVKNRISDKEYIEKTEDIGNGRVILIKANQMTKVTDKINPDCTLDVYCGITCVICFPK